MNENDVRNIFTPLYSNFNNAIDPKKRPAFLSHYTSISVLEKIIKDHELWLSNPLMMNDLEEMQFGMNEGLRTFNEYAAGPDFLKKSGNSGRADFIRAAFGNMFFKFDLKHAVDIFVFCMSKHDPKKDSDGKLSMWRAYGANGNGAALVFNTSFLKFDPDSPLLFAEVIYKSREQRRKWIKTIFVKCLSKINRAKIPDDMLLPAVHHMFELMKLYALLAKHPGFEEEQEWRMIYLPDRDIKGTLRENFHYIVGNKGVEPKLKLPLAPLSGDAEWTFHSILDRIILGPSYSSGVSQSAVCKMFAALKRPEFIEKLRVSGIPLRPA